MSGDPELMRYDEDGYAKCPDCSGVLFRLILPQARPANPQVECEACGIVIEIRESQTSH